jgi:hypothetical protein
MQEKIVIRKKALANRKNKYFHVSDNFFKPIIELLKNKKKIHFFHFHCTTLQIMK